MEFVTFLVPGLSNGIKGWYKPNHIFWGVAIFGVACAALLTGASEKASGLCVHSFLILLEIYLMVSLQRTRLY
jgi:hypothetical protein